MNFMMPNAVPSGSQSEEIINVMGFSTGKAHTITYLQEKSSWCLVGWKNLLGKEQRASPWWGRFPTVALHGCPQQFGTKTRLKGAADMC